MLEVELGNESLKKLDLFGAYVHFDNAQGLFASINESFHQAGMLREMGWIKAYHESFTDAVVNYLNAYKIYETSDKYIDKQLDILSKLRDIYYKQGNIEEFSTVTSIISNKLSGATDQLILMAKDMENQGNDSKALLYYKEAYNYTQEDEFQRKNIEKYLGICSKLMTLSYTIGNYEDALSYEKEMRVIEQKHQIEPIRVAEYNRDATIGKSLVELGKEEEAIKYIDFLHEKYENSSNVLEMAFPYEIELFAFQKFGRYELALDCACKADSILAGEYPEESDERKRVLKNKIKVLSSLGCHNEAVLQFMHLMDLNKRVYDENYKTYKDDLLQLANYEAFSGATGNEIHKENAKTHMAQCVAMEIDAIKKQIPWLTPEQRTNLWNKVQENLQQVSGFAIGLHSYRDWFTTATYNAHVLATGLLLQTEKSMTDAIKKHGSEEDIRLLNELTNLKETADKKQNVDAVLQLRIQSIESQLTKTTAELADYTKFLDVDFDSIHAQLRTGEVLVDFSENNHTDNSDKSILAFILRPEWEHPLLMRVCTYSKMTQISESFDASIYENGKSQEVRRLLMDSVLQYVHPGERLFYVPSGIVHGIAVENLMTEDGRYLSDKHDITRLSSAREIVGIHEKRFCPNTAVLYGGLSYGDYTQENINTESASNKPDGEERGLADAYTKLRTSEFEVKNVRFILKKSSVKSVLYSKEEGTEESFMALDRQSPDIIHLATHGYYLSPEQAKKVKGLEGYNQAMQLSGLVMSGGNAGWLGIPMQNGVLDGLLSAVDISKLDLSNTKLVVLSACKTAKGTTSPEGVFGLQRAFKKAGAGTLVMTLWNVHDEVTTLFMIEFYKELVKCKWDKHTAFGKARDTIRSNKKYQEPYYWAGFILLD